jgi:hypothetical protein
VGQGGLTKHEQERNKQRCAIFPCVSKLANNKTIQHADTDKYSILGKTKAKVEILHLHSELKNLRKT